MKYFLKNSFLRGVVSAILIQIGGVSFVSSFDRYSEQRFLKMLALAVEDDRANRGDCSTAEKRLYKWSPMQ